MKPKLDPFTQTRMKKWVEDFRRQSGQLPTLTDFETAHFSRETVELALKSGLIEEYYVKQTNGVVRKGYKLRVDSPF